MLAYHSSTRLSDFIRRRILFIAVAIAIGFLAVSCTKTEPKTTVTAAAGIAPQQVADYIHAVLAADRTAYSQHVVNRAKQLEGQKQTNGVINTNVAEAWQQVDGIPLPAQMFRLGAEIASEDGTFTYGLISPWNINDNQSPKNEFEKTAMQTVIETGEPFKDYQEIGGKPYFSVLYPDQAIAESCITCHNNHPIHKARYPDKVFKMGEVMGGIIINLPLENLSLGTRIEKSLLKKQNQ